MPDKRSHRGPHPEDGRLFAPSQHPLLRAAHADLCWLLSRDYAWKSALKLVGDRYDLTARQRIGIWRSACSDAARHARRQQMHPIETLRDGTLAIDGYNLLITVESALGGGVILEGHDGCYRDLASMHGTYRKVDETIPAITLVGDFLAPIGLRAVEWILDSPVSNSGRLRALILDIASNRGWNWQARLETNPDRHLVDCGGTVVSTDSWVLDHCRAWVNLARLLIDARIPAANVINLSPHR